MQGRLGAWIGSLESNCMQAPAELQMIAYYRIMLQNERSNPAVHFSSVPSATSKWSAMSSGLRRTISVCLHC